MVAVPVVSGDKPDKNYATFRPMQNAVELDLTRWREEPVPKLWSEEWRAANHGTECYVFEHEGKLMVSDYRPGSALEYCTADGCFNGLNKGEFGGELWFEPYNGEKYRLLYCNPVAVFAVNGQYYLLEGLAHLDVSRGGIYVLEYDGARYSARKLQDLHAAPRVVLVQGFAAYILVDKRLYKWDLGGGKSAITTIADIEALYALYPHSMVKQGDEFIIGARGGITVVNEKTGLVRWFVRP